MMAYSTLEQLTLDLNWYFTDRFKRIVHVASAGGLLPSIIAENDEPNDAFHQIVFDMPAKYESERSELALRIVKEKGIEDIDSYFSYFEKNAKRGLYSFDRYNDNDPDDSRYFLVAYPLYDPYIDAYPFQEEQIALLARTRASVRNTYKNPIDLNSYLRMGNVY